MTWKDSKSICRLPFFGTSEGQLFWRNIVSNWVQLGDVGRDLAFVAIDLEGLDEITQIGLAYLKSYTPKTLTSIQSFLNDQIVDIRCIDVKTPNRQRRREEATALFSKVKSEDVERAILDILDDWKAKDSRPFVFVAFAAAREVIALATYFPKAAPYFSACVDVRDLIYDLQAPGPLFRSRGKIPSLFSILELLEIANLESRAKSRHNASNDAVRTLAVLASLTERFHSNKRLVFPPRDMKHAQKLVKAKTSSEATKERPTDDHTDEPKKIAA